MAGQQLPFAEGASINRPPLFCGENYPFWKVRMQIFMESVDRGIWRAVVDGYKAPTYVVEGKESEKPFDLWSQDEVKKGAWDSRAKNIIHSALNSDEFFRISACTTAKEMWELIQVVHEGTEEVRRARKNTLIQEYETFRMIRGESIGDVQKRFSHIVNHLKGLGKVFDEEELNVKVLKALNRTWQAKVTAIAESKDLGAMKNPELFGKLREHEMDLFRITEDEEKEKKTRSIALKSSTFNDTSEDSETEESLATMVRKFKRFLKSNKNVDDRNRNRNKNRSEKGNASTSNNFTCFECGKPGHIKPDCPVFLKKKNGEKKSFQKKKKAYIAWDDNDLSSSSSDSEQEEANLCLMARSQNDDESDSDVSTSSSQCSVNENDFGELLEAFNELHGEAQKLKTANNVLKSKIRSHTNNCKSLEEMISNFQKENAELQKKIDDISYKEKGKEKLTSNIICENCEGLSQKVKNLEATLSKFTRGGANLTALLKAQRSTEERGGLGYKPATKKAENKGFRKHSHKPSVSNVKCHYCMKIGHKIYECDIKNYAVPCGHMKWVKKILPANIQGPRTIWVPKSS